MIGPELQVTSDLAFLFQNEFSFWLDGVGFRAVASSLHIQRQTDASIENLAIYSI